MTALTAYMDKIDNLTLRERVILLAGGLILILLFWFNLFHEPLEKEKEALRIEIDQKRGEAETLALQLQILSGKKQEDPNERNRQRREELEAELAVSKDAIVAATTNLVAPDRMPQLLKSVLSGIPGLQLVKLNGLGKTPLIEPEPAAEGEEQATMTQEPFETAYKHGMRIEFEGDFLTTVQYIRKLESLEWRFFWDSVELRVQEYPRSVSSVTLYTLSMEQDWIGI
ncbi:MAG: hypothetical protein MI673_03935 [Thiotrichales bacterium]|nr:hypothetical protein [Thiotrichales bacterium]